MRSVALLLLATTLLSAEEPEALPRRPLTFAEAVDLALAYNLNLRSTRLNAILQRLVVDESDAAWDPVLSATGSLDETLIPSRSSLAGADIVDSDNASFTLGVTKPFRLGPSLGVVWRTDRTFTNSTFSTLNPAYDTALEVSLTVPLLRGRGREAQESELRASRASAEEARYALRDEAARLIGAVADAYWNLAYLDRRVGVLAKSVEVAREVEATERRKLEPEIGRSTALDVTQAEAETKRRETALLQGKLEAENAADTLRALILPFSGGPGDDVVMHAATAPADEAALLPLARVLESGLRDRPDLARLDAEIERHIEGVRAAQNGLRHQLDLTATGTWRGLGGGFEESAGDSLSGKTPSARAVVSYTWTFGRRAAKAALHRAEIELEQVRLRRDELVSTVIVEIRAAHRALRTAMEEIRSTREEVRAAKASLDGERQRLARGSSTVLDVSRLEENLTSAELRLIQARTKLEQARIALERATGSLLATLGVAFHEDLTPTRGKLESAP